MGATYTKLRSGDWGVKVDGKVNEGAQVQVRKQNGSVKVERIGRVVWTGADSRTGATVSICSIERAGPSSTSRSRDRGKWNGCSCGAREYDDGTVSDNACADCKFDAYDC